MHRDSKIRSRISDGRSSKPLGVYVGADIVQYDMDRRKRREQ